MLQVHSSSNVLEGLHCLYKYYYDLHTNVSDVQSRSTYRYNASKSPAKHSESSHTSSRVEHSRGPPREVAFVLIQFYSSIYVFVLAEISYFVHHVIDCI